MPSGSMQYIDEVCNRRQAQNQDLSKGIGIGIGIGKVLLTNSQRLAKLLINQPIKALLIQHDRKKA
jgi:4-hydroxy-3-methylbut-2-enyl diphosphate reductase IspH